MSASEGNGVSPFVRDDDLVRYQSLFEARAFPGAVAVLFGDFGGEIYLTAPVRLVRCTEEQLMTLHSDLDAITWMGGDAFAAGISYEDHAIPSSERVEVVDGVWVLPGLGPEVAALAREVVGGTRSRLPAPVLVAERAARLAELRQRRSEPATARWLIEQGLAWDYVLDPVVPFPPS